MQRPSLLLQSCKLKLNRLITKIHRYNEIPEAILRWICRKIYIFGTDAGNETGILAISMMVNRRLHTIERFLWFIIICTSIMVGGYLSTLQIKRYNTSPTVISLDRDYRDWNGTLPAVTLCYYERIDFEKATEFIEDSWNISELHDDFNYFMNFLHAVVNATVVNYGDLARYAEDERFEDIDLFDLVRSIDRPFEQVLNSFDSNYEMQVLPVMTERGSCYAINSPVSAILTGSYVEFSDLKQPLVCQYGKQQCYIRMDLFESTGTIDVHAPYEVSALDATVIALQKSDEITASYKVLETVASENLRDLKVSQRKCVFHDEEAAKLKIYSKTLCLVRCRAMMALEMCNCVPFFYPFVDGPSCNPAGFDCLLDFKWPIWALHICKCPNTCTEIEYIVQTVKRRTWGLKSNEEELRSDQASSSFRWDLIPPKVRMSRDVVFSFADLLVSFGGVLALFLGISLLSIAQLSFVLLWNILEILYELFEYLRRTCICRRDNAKKLNSAANTGATFAVIKSVGKWNLLLHAKRQKRFTKKPSNKTSKKINIKKHNLLSSQHLDNTTVENNEQNHLEESWLKPEFPYLN